MLAGFSVRGLEQLAVRSPLAVVSALISPLSRQLPSCLRRSKTCLNLLMSRIMLLQNKRDAQLKQMLPNSCRLAKRQLLEFGWSISFENKYMGGIRNFRVLKQLEGNHLSSTAILSQDGSVWVQL
ncbi:uncharacterized protein DS421_11g347340 [Arachis hypogaea]|nr:uncharacterized protein DS421_11g347340 [Arachis hypogaea]